MKRKILTNVKRLRGLAVVIAIIAVCFVAFYLYRGVSSASISIGSDKTIAVTPEKILEIKQIGQWEFLSIVDEQVVDTVRHNTILTDDRLACIYYGNPRLGIDLKKAADDWVVNHNDTITVTLPYPGLLDENFIDEARTVVFYERGRWGAYAKDRMYRTAKHRMKQYALTPDNIAKVKRSAEDRFRSLFLALGAKDVTVTFEEPSEFSR